MNIQICLWVEEYEIFLDSFHIKEGIMISILNKIKKKLLKMYKQELKSWKMSEERKKELKEWRNSFS